MKMTGYIFGKEAPKDTGTKSRRGQVAELLL
jgi:hypothetical protein